MNSLAQTLSAGLIILKTVAINCGQPVMVL